MRPEACTCEALQPIRTCPVCRRRFKARQTGRAGRLPAEMHGVAGRGLLRLWHREEQEEARHG